MEAIQNLLATPSWAYSVCYVYLISVVALLISGIYAFMSLFKAKAAVMTLIPLFASAVISTVIGLVLAMMQFWICRGALRPSKESFAVSCGGATDCTAVMGTQPAGSLCTCGARGFCAGCVMNNTMEPQASYDAEFAPVEGFVSPNPKLRSIGLGKPAQKPAAARPMRR